MYCLLPMLCHSIHNFDRPIRVENSGFLFEFLAIKTNKMSAWRQAGLNYINYSNIAAQTLRKALKPELRADALKRDATYIKITPWANGKPAPIQAAKN